MQTFVERLQTVQAIRFTAGNMATIQTYFTNNNIAYESLGGGRYVAHFWHQDVYFNAGDWAVKEGNGVFRVMTDTEFNTAYILQ